jgi:hypothetical protein
MPHESVNGIAGIVSMTNNTPHPVETEVARNVYIKPRQTG